MSEPSTKVSRIQSTDALAELHLDLCRQALTIQPYDGDARQGWIDAARSLLAAVPDTHQRLAWAIQLAIAFGMHLPGTPIELLVLHLQEKT